MTCAKAPVAVFPTIRADALDLGPVRSRDDRPPHDPDRSRTSAGVMAAAIVVLAGDVEHLSVHPRHAARVRFDRCCDDPVDLLEIAALEVVCRVGYDRLLMYDHR